MTKKTKVITEEEIEEVTQEQANVKLQYDVEFDDFLNENKQAASIYKIHIFKKKVETGLVGRNKYEYLQTVDGYVPGWDQIGNEFEGGTYQLNGVYTGKDGKRHTTCRVITISDRYNKKPETQPGLVPAVAANSDNAFVMKLLQEQNQQMMTAMLGMMEKSLAPNENKGTAKLQEQLNQMMIGSATTQMELINKMSQKNLRDAQVIEPDEEDRDEGTIVTEIFELLMWVWNEHGKKLLGAPKILQRGAKKQVHDMPELNEILQDPKIYKKAYDKVCEQVDPADIQELLRIVDVPTPDELNLIPMERQG